VRGRTELRAFVGISVLCWGIFGLGFRSAEAHGQAGKSGSDSSILTITEESHFTKRGGTVCVTTTGLILVKDQATFDISISDGRASPGGKAAPSSQLSTVTISYDDRATVKTSKTANDTICVDFRTPVAKGQQITVAVRLGSTTIATSSAFSIDKVSGDHVDDGSVPNLWSPSARIVLGYERGGAGPLAPVNNYTVDLALQTPFGSYRAQKVVEGSDPNHEVPNPQWCADDLSAVNTAQLDCIQRNRTPWASGALRLNLAGLPTTTLPNLTKVLAGTSPINSLEQVVNGLSLSSALEIHPRMRPFAWPGGTTKEAYWIEPTLLLEVGVTTTLDASIPTAITAPTTFSAVENPTKPYDSETNPNAPGLTSLYPKAAGKTYLTLVPTNPSRFFRQAAVGLRVKTHHLDCGQETGFPGIIDFTIGGDESITPGQFGLNVVHFSGFYALPSDFFSSSVFVFGSVAGRLSHHAPLVPSITLTAAPPLTTPSYPASQTDVEFLSPRSFDTWRVGMGVDLVALIKKMQGKSASSSSSTGGMN
jgi:hypothetical protein